MYYELYLDSLFLLNFIMNLYLLLLVNYSTFRTATRRRLVLGAMAGTAVYLSAFVPGGPVWLKSLLGTVGSTAVMLAVSFRIRTLRAFLNIVERLFF